MACSLPFPHNNCILIYLIYSCSYMTPLKSIINMGNNYTQDFQMPSPKHYTKNEESCAAKNHHTCSDRFSPI